MRTISVKISDRLHQELEAMAQLHETKLSDVVRECINIGLQNLDSNTKRLNENLNLQIYCLLEKFIKETVEEGDIICQEARELALQTNEDD